VNHKRRGAQEEVGVKIRRMESEQKMMFEKNFRIR